MERGYKKMNVTTFGRQLITSGDLDPVYIAMVKAPWDDGRHRARFLIAYWCFYHVGFACYAADQQHGFWEVMMDAALNTSEAPIGGRWPRSSERRHARGAQGIKMVQDLRAYYYDRPEAMIETITANGHLATTEDPISYKLIAERAMKHTLFGPWIAFKIADMVDRCLGIPVSFDQAEVFMFKDPTKAALKLWREAQGFDENVQPKDVTAAITQVVSYLKDQFSDLTAPPFYDRAIGLQEVETVLCKWKSHMNGHYKPFNDITEISHGLTEWTKVSETARSFAYAMPKVPA